MLRIFSYLTLTLISLVPLGFGLYLAVDIPNADDFDLFLGFVNEMSKGQLSLQRLGWVFNSHNEHVVFLNRLIAILLIALKGALDFQVLIFFGCLGLVLSLCLVGLGLRENKQLSYYQVLPALLLVLSPQYVSATQWATTSISTFWMQLFSFLAIHYWLNKGYWAVGVSLLFAILSSITLGSGFAVWPVLLLSAILQKKPIKFTIALTVSLIVYFSFFSNSVSAVSQGLDVIRFLHFYVLLCGSGFAFGHEVVALINGIALLGGFAFLSLRGECLKSPRLWSYALFCLIVFAAISYGRSNMNLELAYTIGRYRFFSLWLLGFVYLMFVGRLPSGRARKIQHLPVLLALCFLSSSMLLNYKDYLIRHEGLLDSAALWSEFGEGLWHPSELKAVNILRVSEDLGVYKMPRFPRDSKEVACPNNNKSISSIITIDKVLQSEDRIALLGYGFLKGGPAFSLVRLRGVSQHCYLLSSRYRPDVYSHFFPDAPRRSGFFALSDTRQLEEGEYSLDFMMLKDGRWLVHKSNRKILLKELKVRETVDE